MHYDDVNDDLKAFIDATPLIDSHEHLWDEAHYIEQGPDVLADLMSHYLGHDLVSAGAPPAAVERAQDGRDPDVAGRWAGIQDYWQHCRLTGYGEGARLTARLVYGMEEITLAAIQAAAPINRRLRQPGQRLRLLQAVANLDHVQIDDFEWQCGPDASGVDFFLYDLSWVAPSAGRPDIPGLQEATGVEVRDVATLREALAGIFARYGRPAIAVKTQHAYSRPLRFIPRTDEEVAAPLRHFLKGDPLAEADMLCLGDWCLERGLELAAEYGLPVKIHTGYFAGNQQLTNPDATRAGHLAPLFARHPQVRFVLMHMAYPYSGEVLALAKHFPNVYLDMCWAWSINPHDATDFLRRVLHGVPLNKLFLFGGDSFYPAASVGYAAQARAGLYRALRAEIDEGFTDQTEARAIAERVMGANQRAVFDIEGTRAALRAADGPSADA
jgi:predicted TIM-barrel fold metal-dependent hydrolase